MLGSLQINHFFNRTACSEICKHGLHIEHVDWDLEGFRTSCRANASGYVGSLSRGATSTKYARNKLPHPRGRLCWLEAAFQPNTSSSILRFKRPAMCKHHCLRLTWTRSRLQTVFPQPWPRRYAALSECGNATTFCHSQHASALFSKELGTLINSSFYSLLTLGDFAISSPQ